jgi:hypothetical protein
VVRIDTRNVAGSFEMPLMASAISFDEKVTGDPPGNRMQKEDKRS